MEPIDKKFTDHAWGQMHQLLDVEMPATKRRRRFAWWWLGLGLALVVATGAGVFFLNRPPAEPRPAAAVEPMVAESTQQPDSQGTANDFSEGKMEKTESTEGIPPISTVAAPKKVGAPQMNPTAKRPTVAKELLKQAGVDPLFLTEKSTRNESATAPTPLEAPQTRPEILAPEALGLLAIQPLPIDEQNLTAVDIDIVPRKRVILSAQTSAFALPSSEGRGLGAGLLATVPLGKSRFSIETGLTIDYLQQPLFIIADDSSTDIDPTTLDPIFQYSDTRITFENSAGPILDAAISEENRSSIRLKNRLDLYYLRLPVEVSYRHNRLRAIAGMNTGLLLASRSDFTTGGLLIFNKDNRLDQSTGGSGIFADLSEKMKVRTLDLAAVGGLGYDLSPTLGIDLRYRLGLTDVLPGNNAKDFNRFLQLSLRYRIGGW